MLRHLTYDYDYLGDWWALESTKLAATYTPPQHCAPHPECNIISYLHSQSSLNPPPLAAIGISSPACAACALWIDTFHGRMSRNSFHYDYPVNQNLVRRKGKYFRYRGSSDVWCWPWTLPGAIGAKEAVMVEEVEGRCRAVLRGAGMYEYHSSILIDEDLRKGMRAEMAIEMARWAMEVEVICVFGCQRRMGCQCFNVLWEE